MGKLSRVMRCYNCGDILQYKNKDVSGYVPEGILLQDNAEEQVIYCETCYARMKAVNTGLLEEDADDDILTILDEAVISDALILWVVDLFSFNGFLSHRVADKLNKLDVIVIGNKFDLFPRTVKEATVKLFLKERFAEVGIVPKKILVFGNSDDFDSKKVLSDLEHDRAGRDVYMIGSSVSGKTSLINKALKAYSNNSKRIIKTEIYPNTNAKILEIPFDKESTFYEVPGFSLINSTLGKVEKDVIRMIIPKEKIDVKTVHLREGDAFIIGSLGAFVLESGKYTSMKFYSSEMVEIKKVDASQVKSEFLENFVKRTVRPVSDHISQFTDYDVFEYTMEDDEELHDIGIMGLGWVTFEARGQIIRVFLPKGVAVKECLSKVRRHK